MRKLFFLIIFGLIALLGINASKNEELEIRIRVIANSDTASDQNNKVKIKEELISILENYASNDYNELDKNIEENLQNIENHFQDVKITYGIHNFPDKTYNGNILPSKSVKTLLVVIGEGKGKNWWGTLYPKYLGVSGEKEVEYRFLVDDIIGGKE